MMEPRKNCHDVTTVDPEIRKAMLDAIANAGNSGIDDHTLDRMRLVAEFFTNPEFKSAMTERIRSIVMG
jgi:hypothetical protein